ncbi:MAG: hypothetical protein ACXW2U_08020 [Telluria sp.]
MSAIAPSSCPLLLFIVLLISHKPGFSVCAEHGSAIKVAPVSKERRTVLNGMVGSAMGF